MYSKAITKLLAEVLSKRSERTDQGENLDEAASF